MTATRDGNGARVFRNVAREGGGWGATVWMGGYNGLATDVRRYVYRTRQQARFADISDTSGRCGRIA